MYARRALTRTRLLVGAATVACTLFAAKVTAEDHNVTVAILVSTKGIDLSQPADALTFYTRLENAAWVACTRGNRVNLLPVDDVTGCYEKALGGAIGSAKRPTLSQIYLATHPFQAAAAQGIEVPVQVAAK